MSKSPFRRIRTIPDKVLGTTLMNHSGALRYVVGRVTAYDRWRWVRRAWYVLITTAVVWLAYKQDILTLLSVLGWL